MRDEAADRADPHRHLRTDPPPVPEGRARLKWYGPGLLWMLSSVGSGSVLFTPRIGSAYGYGLLWLLLIVVFFQWAMIREVGRYTVCTGRTLLDGFGDLPGPRGWAIWMIFLPQVLAAVVTVAGIAALAGSALMIALPGSQAAYGTAMIALSILLVLTGRYGGVEKTSVILAGILVLAAVGSAAIVFPSPGPVTAGIVPGVPEGFDFYFVLPWVGFILAGAAGIIWFSYWISAKGYGGAVTQPADTPEREREGEADERERIVRLAGWLRIMDRTAQIGILGGGLVILSFLVLGAEILRPEGIVPEGVAVAEDLARLLGDLWGAIGRWVLIIGILIALWGTILSNQDGWGRTFADATLLLAPSARRRDGWLRWLLEDRTRLKNAYALTATALVPLIVFLVMREPVAILSVGGIVAAAHTPIVVFLTWRLNRRHVPAELRAGWFMTAMFWFAGLFFTAFALLYFADLLGWRIVGGS